MMVERRLFAAINAGLDYFKADGRRIETLATRLWCLEPAEAANLRTFFELDPATGEHGGPPTVIHGYPRQAGPFPCWAIILEGDPIRQKALGDDWDVELDEDEDDIVDLDGNPARQSGMYVQHRIGLYTYAQDIPDIALYYYHLLRYILQSSAEGLSEVGLQNLEMQGQDLAPDGRYLPENIWIRRLGVTVESDNIAYESPGLASKIRTLAGAYLEEATESVDGLAHNITPYVES